MVHPQALAVGVAAALLWLGVHKGIQVIKKVDHKISHVFRKEKK